eukprot:6463821-Amphidinium_carterae.2
MLKPIGMKTSITRAKPGYGLCCQNTDSDSVRLQAQEGSRSLSIASNPKTGILDQTHLQSSLRSVGGSKSDLKEYSGQARYSRLL